MCVKRNKTYKIKAESLFLCECNEVKGQHDLKKNIFGTQSNINLIYIKSTVNNTFEEYI